MIAKQPKKGALLSAKFARKSPSLDTEIETFRSELTKLAAKHPAFVVAEQQKGDELEIDVFPAKVPQEALTTKKMKKMSAEEAAELVKKSAAPKEKAKASPLAASTSSGAGFKKKR